MRAAFRLVVLWMDADNLRDALTALIIPDKELERVSPSSPTLISVPLKKLLPLVPQLFSRLTASDKSSFQTILVNTIHLLSLNFPAYCIWQLVSLSNITHRCDNGERLSTLYKGDPAKKGAADDILRRLSTKENFKRVIDDTISVSDAYISLSTVTSKKDRRESNEMSIT